MPRLLISSLGALSITLDGKPITADFDTDKTRALLIYLVIESSRPHPRNRLAGILWPDQPEQHALHSLRQRLSHLRKILGDETAAVPFLLITRDAIQWNPASDYWLDAQAFDHALAASYHHYQRRNGPGWLNIHLLKRAMQFYRGQFLELFSPVGSDLFAEWASLQREDRNRRAVEALALLADYHERRGEFVLARQAVGRIVDLAPWEETAQAQMMRLLAMDQQWSAAQNQYAILRRFLREQLGVEPSQATTALFNEIRGAAAKNLPFPPRQPPLRQYLPDLPTPFIGREADLSLLSERLSDPECRLLTLLGPGGIGKTRLALEAAREQLGVTADGVFFVPLVAVRTNELLLPNIADALGLVFTDRNDPQTQLLDYLRNKQLLLVLDNFEHLLSAPGSTELLVEILHQAPGVMLLVTSRQRLNLQEECIHHLNGMSYPPEGSLQPHSPESFDALALFAQRARQVRGSFALDPTSLPAVIQICQAFDGLPLGVELAAAATWDCTCAEIIERIARGFNELTASASNGNPKHRSLRAAFDISWQLLNPDQQAVFCLLGVFRGGFEAAAVEAVTGLSLAEGRLGSLLSALVDKSLLRRSSNGRYDLHEVVRQYAAETLAEMPERSASAQARHAHYYADFIADQNSSLKGAGQALALEVIHREIENTRNAWVWLIENNHSDGISRCVDSLYQYFNICSRFGEGIEWFQQATQMMKSHTTSKLALGIILTRLGSLAFRSRTNDLASEALNQGHEILSCLDEPQELAFCLVALGGLQLRRKDYDPAMAFANKALDLYQTSSDEWGISHALYLLGLIKNRMGRFDEALLFLEKTLSVSRRLNNQYRLIAPLNLLGDIACTKGDFNSAEKFFQESLEISRSLNDRYNQALLLNNLATVYQAKQQYDQERAVFEASLVLCREIGDRDGEAIALNGLGEMAVHLGQFEQAVYYSQQALQIAQQVDEVWTIIVCLNNLGEAYCGIGDTALAEAHLRKALQSASEIQAVDLLVRVVITLGRVYQQRAEINQAVQLIQAGLAHSAIDDEPRVKARRWLMEMNADVEVEQNDEALEMVTARQLLMT
jgi:predicted ATPase/DNA-binding SARP family transcriptional activator/Flp pilus assembly protein TadD